MSFWCNHKFGADFWWEPAKPFLLPLLFIRAPDDGLFPVLAHTDEDERGLTLMVKDKEVLFLILGEEGARESPVAHPRLHELVSREVWLCAECGKNRETDSGDDYRYAEKNQPLIHCGLLSPAGFLHTQAGKAGVILG